MKIALVAMPWPQFDAPSGALGSLSAYMRRERPDHEVTCVYAYVELWRRMESVYESSSASLHAELMYLPLLYPESRQRVREFLVGQRRRWCMADDDAEAGAMFDAMLEAEEQHAAEVARALTGFDVIGFTVTYAQLHSSLVVARALRRLGCEATIVLGGAGVDAGCGPSVMAQHPEVDLVVQGEGERTVVDLVDALDRGEPVDLPGVITRQTDLSAWSFSPAQRLANQVEDLDSLPVPEYAEYAELAEELSIFWIISTETSRGCWWNRALTTGDPLKACYFCNLNMGSYREKSVARAAGEIRALVQGHGNVRLRLMDNVMRNRGLPEIFDALAEPPMDLRFSTEVRASIRPYDLMRMWEAGCHHVQIGVEGLSTAYLKRLGKGATTIQNLQALKTCFELDLHSTSNLLTHFPGATAEEVDETVRNLEAYATGYRLPPHLRLPLHAVQQLGRLPRARALRPDQPAQPGLHGGPAAPRGGGRGPPLPARLRRRQRRGGGLGPGGAGRGALVRAARQPAAAAHLHRPPVLLHRRGHLPRDRGPP